MVADGIDLTLLPQVAQLGQAVQESGQARQVEGSLQLGCGDLLSSIHLMQDTPLSVAQIVKVHPQTSGQMLVGFQVSGRDRPQGVFRLPQPVAEPLDEIGVVVGQPTDFGT